MGRRSVIIIDDEILIRDLLYDFFTEKEWEVAAFDTGTRALEALRSRHFDVALIDLKLPEEDGLSLIRKVKDLYPAMPIVIMTAYPSVDSAIEAIRLKVDDYIKKPFNINKLFKALFNLVNEEKSEVAAEVAK